MLLVPLLPTPHAQVYSSTVMSCVRACCLATITKLLAVGSPQQLQVVLADLPISSFVAGLLTSRDLKAQAAAIQMAELLMAKLPQVFAGFFVKEGVAHALEQLAATAGDGGAAADAAARAGNAGEQARAGAAAAVEGRRPSGSGASLPPPSPPLTRSRRTSKSDQVSRQS
jgi:E3 ubiquitin-protein ligase TRIP12